MKKKTKFFYTDYALRCFRNIAIICCVLLFTARVFKLFTFYIPCIKENKFFSLGQCFENIINFLALILFAIIAIVPRKFGLTAYIAFMYALDIIPTEPENLMGPLMFFLGICLLAVRGFFKDKRKLKICILFLIYMGAMMLNLRLGFGRFLHFCIFQAGGILVLALIVFFVHNYDVDTLMFQDKKLNLASYPGLDIRDCDILQRIQKKEKYSSIARDIALSEGALKNRLHFVFKTLGVGDRNGFLTYYSDWEIFFDLKSAEKDLENESAEA